MANIKRKRHRWVENAIPIDSFPEKYIKLASAVFAGLFGYIFSKEHITRAI